MKKTLGIVMVLAVVLAMLALVAKRKKAMKSVKPCGMRPVAVHVAAVTKQPLERMHSYLGVVEPWQAARISSRISARVESVFFYEGDLAKKGELLLQLDDGDIQVTFCSMPKPPS